jgi:hypothetical protein
MSQVVVVPGVLKLRHEGSYFYLRCATAAMGRRYTS